VGSADDDDAALIITAVNLSPAMVAVVRAARPFARIGGLVETEADFDQYADTDEVAVVVTVAQVDALRAALAALDREEK
jgi:hypothetical protein